MASVHFQVPCDVKDHPANCEGWCNDCGFPWPCDISLLEAALEKARKDVAMLAAIRWVAQKVYDDEGEPIGRRGFACTVLNMMNGLESAEDYGHPAANVSQDRG